MSVVIGHDGLVRVLSEQEQDVCLDGPSRTQPISVVMDSVGSTLKKIHHDIKHYHDPEAEHQRSRKEYWITRHFRALRCVCYVQNTAYPKESTMCMCGLKLEEHKNSQIIKHGSDWSTEDSTEAFPTNAYGHINFTKIEADFLPKYVRFKHDTDIKYIRELILEKWKLPKTYLIMVVIGGLGEQIRETDDNTATTNKRGYRKVNTETRDYIDKIKDGLVEAALSTQAWIITSGVDSGVSKLVGKAVGTRRTFTQTIPTLGICSWGTIRDTDHLVADDGQGLFPAHYTVTEKSRVSNLIGLDNNHTAFLFPDFGTYRDFHIEEMTKAKLDIEIALKDATESNVITILIEGGMYSLIETKDRIRNKIPIVVMVGTGRAADLVGCAKQLFEKYGRERSNADFIAELKAEFQEHLFESADSNAHTKEAFAAILTILDSENLVTIWDPKQADKGKVDKAILLGLINSLAEPDSDSSKKVTDNSDDSATEETPTDKTAEYKREFNQLELAIKWNRLDLAEEHLFKGKQFTVTQLNELLWIALEHKEEGFVTAIMKKGASLKYFLTERRFCTYLNSKSHGKSILKKMLKKHASKKCQSGDETRYIYEHFEAVIYDISQGVYKCPKKFSPSAYKNELVKRHPNLLSELCGLGYSQVKKLNMMEFCKRSNTNKQDFEDPENLLVLYFVLEQEHAIAKCLWRYSRTPLILSLICAHICQWLADQERRRKEITGEDKQQLMKFSEEWEELALKIVNVTKQSYDTQWVKTLVKHKFYAWKGRSSLEIASYMKSKRFIAHPSVHINVTNMWMGAMDSDTSYMAILVGIFISPVFITIKKNKQMIDSVVSEAELKEKQRRDFINQKKTLTHSDTEAYLTSHKKGWSPIHAVAHGLYKLVMFHKAPVTKYFVNLIFYLIFLVIFLCALIINEDNSTYFLTTYSTTKFSILEWIVIIYITSSIPLEFRQIYHSMPSTLSGKLKCYISSPYNKNDVAGFLILGMAVLTKLGYFMLGTSIKYDMYNMLAYKTLMGMTFTLATTRLLQFLQINSKMGPKITTIARMMYDLLFFVLIISIFIMAYGVATEAIIFPVGKNNTIVDLFNFVWRPYIHLFGELALEDLDDQLGEGYCKLKLKFLNATQSKMSKCEDEDGRNAMHFDCKDDMACQYAKLVIQMSMMVYMILASALMLNLLIAVFSKTYDNMYYKQDLHWKWQRYELMVEFKHRSAIPFPFNVVAHVWRVVRWVWRRCCTRGSIGYFERRDVQKKNDEFKKAEISLLERECLRNIVKRMEEKMEQADKDTLSKHAPPTRAFSTLRPISPSKRNIPKPYGHAEELDETEIDSMLVGAQVVPVTFCSPTTPPLDRRETKLERLISDIPENTAYPDPRSRTIRYSMPAGKRDWDVPLPNYKPAFLNINDKEGTTEEWNVSGKNASYEGHYLVEKGYPHNPLGRTGVFGKGLLPRYGPNFKSIPVLTRFQSPTEASALDTPLEVLVYLPNPNTPKEMRLPEFKSLTDEPITTEFSELLMNSTVSGNEKLVVQNIKRLLRRGILIKRGAVDDAFNTDNSWWEVFITSYHDDEDDALRHVSFQAGSGYRWVKAREDMFQDNVHSKYFNRVIYSRRVSRYTGHIVSI